MRDVAESATDARRSGNRVVLFGVAAIVGILVIAAILLFVSLPDANAFNAKVERIFVENDELSSDAEIKLLEILALSGTAFSETLTSYRMVIFVLLVFATALLIAALVFLIMLITLNRRMAQIERSGIQVSSLLISREEKTVYLNNMGFKLTDAAMETLAVLAEARMDDDVFLESVLLPCAATATAVFSWVVSLSLEVVEDDGAPSSLLEANNATEAKGLLGSTVGASVTPLLKKPKKQSKKQTKKKQTKIRGKEDILIVDRLPNGRPNFNCCAFILGNDSFDILTVSLP